MSPEEQDNYIEVEMKSVFCPVCDHENEVEQSYHRYSDEFEQDFYLGKCPECGTLITYPQLTTQQLTDYYKDEEQIGTDRYKKWKKKYRYQYNFLKSELRCHFKRSMQHIH